MDSENMEDIDIAPEGADTIETPEGDADVIKFAQGELDDLRRKVEEDIVESIEKKEAA